MDSTMPHASIGRLSVVVVNYNYATFVAQALESALAIEHDDLEVVVVDDGSTDGSAGVLASFADRATVLITENRGQVAAANTGFAAATGDVVLFLDSDDVLPPNLASQLSRRWTPGTSKAQFRMQRIDSAGRPLGPPFPRYRPEPSSGEIRRWTQLSTAYPTPPGSGNAYARWFLERLMPLGPDVGSSPDSAWLAAAPLLGDVVTVPDVVVGYRRHGGNDSDLSAGSGRFAREVERAVARWDFACRVSMWPEAPAARRAVRRSREVLQFRIAAARVERRYPLAGDSRLVQLADIVRSPLAPGPEPLLMRLGVAAWCAALWICPRFALRALVGFRWGPRRPRGQYPA